MPIEYNRTRTKARAVYYHDGTRDRTPFVPCDGPNDVPDALKRWLNSKESMHLHGKLGQVDHEVTVGSLITAWQDAGQLNSVAPSNQANISGYHRWWLEEFGNAKYATIHRPLVQARLRDRWDNPATRNRARAALGTVISWHMQQGTLLDNVLKGLSEKEVPDTDDAYTDEELLRLFSALKDEEADPRALVACAIALTTGARQAAIWALQVQDLDFGNKLIRFQRNVKRNKHRAIPLQPWVEDLILKLVWPPYDKVTPTTKLFQGKRWGGVTWPKTVWERVLKNSGVERNKPFHALRHTFVTRALGEGVSIQWVCRFTGHSTTTILARYEHLTDQAMARAFSRTEDRRSEAQRLADATRLPSA